MAVRDPSGEHSHPREKTMKTDKNDKEVFVATQELKLARVLAGNDKTTRDRALKSLKKWFAHRSKTLPFTDNDFQIIWKGLFFSMWMSDKPLIQEECAENIASLIHFETFDESVLFFKSGLTILINEWFGIDQLRLDKFLMLVRRLLRQMLMALKRHGLSKKNVAKFSEVLSYTILNTDIHPPVGLFMHFTEIFLEEIAKITKGNMTSECLVDFIQPFIMKLIKTSDGREIEHIKKFIFIYLMKQSDLAIHYQIKYNAWKKVGFPGTIGSMQKVRLDNDNSGREGRNSKNKDDEKPLDPRAGRVNVELPQIKFKPKDIIDALANLKFSKNGNLKSRKAITELIKQFNMMSKGTYPLTIKQIKDTEKKSYDMSIRKAVNRLVKFEKQIMEKEKRKRRRKNDEETEESPPKLRKVNSSKTNVDENAVDEEESNNKDDVTQEELETFIAQSEGNLTKKIKKKKKNSEKQQKTDKIDSPKRIASVQKDESEKKIKRKRKGDINPEKGVKRRKNKEKLQDIIDNIECVFERNSGTWIVFDLGEDEEKVETPSKHTETDVVSPGTVSKNSGPTGKSVKNPSTSSTDLGSSDNENLRPSTSKASPQNSPVAEQGSPKSGLSPVRLFESPQKTAELFPKSSWDEPLQEGEYEICIPSKKHVRKLERQAKKSNQNVHELINISMKRIRAKGRVSLDSSLVKNPFSTPASAKKVKINTKLNQSQEIHEHVQQILSSPGIPYDANKKPLKPLLKTSASSTPVNPFYNKQLKVW